MESNDLFALADELRELKETKKRLEDELKTVGVEIDRVDADLAQRLFDEHRPFGCDVVHVPPPFECVRKPWQMRTPSMASVLHESAPTKSHTLPSMMAPPKTTGNR